MLNLGISQLNFLQVKNEYDKTIVEPPTLYSPTKDQVLL